MTTHSSILAWKIPWMEEPGRLQSMGLQRVRHDWVTSLHFILFSSWLTFYKKYYRSMQTHNIEWAFCCVTFLVTLMETFICRLLLRFPHSSVGKESACSAGDPGLIPGSGRSDGEGIGYLLHYSWASLVAQLVKNPPAMQETWVWSLGWEDHLEKGKATHSNILVWRIPWIIQSMVSQRAEHDLHFHFLRLLHNWDFSSRRWKFFGKKLRKWYLW